MKKVHLPVYESPPLLVTLPLGYLYERRSSGLEGSHAHGTVRRSSRMKGVSSHAHANDSASKTRKVSTQRYNLVS
ncbi:hypothetical protein JYU34_003190 [Plutella xylostella]|uniref:Uncharacterized protein n=1 Tax=Plutella xylostella TaxID=51655 RepID=A0ABQ7QZE8_PLUXY|nr:hypothetical protein JYU34_003190 [Plutella xylostella]